MEDLTLLNQSNMSAQSGMPMSNIRMLVAMTSNARNGANLGWQIARCSEVSADWKEGDREPKQLVVFLNKGHHFTFEKADGKNNIRWFKEAYPKWGKCMDAHASMSEFDGSYGGWTNYYEWKYSEGHTNDADDVKYAAFLRDKDADDTCKNAAKTPAGSAKPKEEMTTEDVIKLCQSHGYGRFGFPE